MGKSCFEALEKHKAWQPLQSSFLFQAEAAGGQGDAVAACRGGAGRPRWGWALQTCANVAILPLGAFQRQGEGGREEERVDWLTSLCFLLTFNTTLLFFRTNMQFPFDTLGTREHLIVDININMMVYLPLHPVPFHPNSDPSAITGSNSGISLNLDEFPEGMPEQINFLELWISYIENKNNYYILDTSYVLQIRKPMQKQIGALSNSSPPKHTSLQT